MAGNGQHLPYSSSPPDSRRSSRSESDVLAKVQPNGPADGSDRWPDQGREDPPIGPRLLDWPSDFTRSNAVGGLNGALADGGTRARRPLMVYDDFDFNLMFSSPVKNRTSKDRGLHEDNNQFIPPKREVSCEGATPHGPEFDKINSEDDAMSDVGIGNGTSWNTAKDSGAIGGPLIRSTTSAYPSHGLPCMPGAGMDGGDPRNTAEVSGRIDKSLVPSTTNETPSRVLPGTADVKTDKGTQLDTVGGTEATDGPLNKSTTGETPSYGPPGILKQSLISALMERTGANEAQLADYMLQSSYTFLGEDHSYDVVSVLLRKFTKPSMQSTQ